MADTIETLRASIDQLSAQVQTFLARANPIIAAHEAGDPATEAFLASLQMSPPGGGFPEVPPVQPQPVPPSLPQP